MSAVAERGRIAVIMPCLNEIARISDALARLQDADWIERLIVVDGGSDDGTLAALTQWPRELAADGAGAGPALTVLHSPPGRGQQLRRGVAEALSLGCDALLFLHVDCALPADAGSAIARTLADPRYVGGAFRIRTVADRADRADRADLSGAAAAQNQAAATANAGPWWLRFADVRARYTRTPYGDQAVFVRAAAYRAVGGFPDQPLMEDLALSRRLHRHGRLARLPQEVRVSGRRFLRRPVMSFVVMNSFPWLVTLGVSPTTLARLYGHIR